MAGGGGEEGKIESSKKMLHINLNEKATRPCVSFLTLDRNTKIETRVCHKRQPIFQSTKRNSLTFFLFTLYLLQLYCPNVISPMGNSGCFPLGNPDAVSYTHLTLPTTAEV